MQSVVIIHLTTLEWFWQAKGSITADTARISKDVVGTVGAGWF